MFEKVKNSFARLIRNSISLPLGKRFLAYGNGEKMFPGWSDVVMSDQDHYTGYSYAAIRNRANGVATLALDNLHTQSKIKDFVHPYLPLIDDSPYFSKFWFWYVISTYLDLEGVFYLFALRNSDATKKGSVLYFKLLNPYTITRLLDTNKLEVVGYRQNINGFTREFNKDMIIEIRELNPFDNNEPYAITDAAKEGQFTLKTSGDYTRHSLKNNINSPGIISTDVLLGTEEFQNFKARMSGHTKGEPVFANGKGAITYEPMQVDLSKAALKEVNEGSRDIVFAVHGVSKTMMGFEQSGTTRETANVQEGLFDKMQTVPRIQLVVDALNLDYKNSYPKEYAANKAIITVNNPSSKDQDAEIKDITVKQTSFDLYDDLIAQGYDEKIAGKYVKGEIGVDELGAPTKEPRPLPVSPTAPTPTEPTPKKIKKKESDGYYERVQINSIELIQNQQSVLENSVINIQEQLVVKAINRIPKLIKNGLVKNDIENEEDLITPQDKKVSRNELIEILLAFYAVIASLIGESRMAEDVEKYTLPGLFKLTSTLKKTIAQLSDKVAASHVDTISKEIYEIARKAALEGKSQQEIISILKTKYSAEMSVVEARRVSRTETNRAFTMSQYEADRQFISQNNLEKRAFKQYHVRSGNPCPFCLQLQAQGLIPFDDAFVELGSSVVADKDGKIVKYNVDFLAVYAGNLHPNCSCDYNLVIKDE